MRYTMLLTRQEQNWIDKQTDKQLLDGLIDIGKTDKDYNWQDRSKACQQLATDYANHPYLKISKLTYKVFKFNFLKENIELTYNVDWHMCNDKNLYQQGISDKLFDQYETIVIRLVNNKLQNN